MAAQRGGILCMIASTIFFAAMAALVRATPAIDSYMLALGRFLVGVLVCVGLFVLGLDRLRWINWPWLIVRGVVGSLAVVIFFWTIPRTGVAKATVLNYTYVIWAALLAVPLLGERLRLGQALAVGVSVAGIALLLGFRIAEIVAADLVALFGGLCSGVAVIAITRCRETDSSTNVFWSQSLFGLLAVAPPLVTHWQTPTAPQLGVMFAVGLLAAGGQLLMTFAYKHTGATQGSLLSLLTPVWSVLIGVGAFHEPLTLRAAFGMLIVIGACAYLAWRPVARASASA